MNICKNDVKIEASENSKTNFAKNSFEVNSPFPLFVFANDDSRSFLKKLLAVFTILIILATTAFIKNVVDKKQEKQQEISNIYDILSETHYKKNYLEDAKKYREIAQSTEDNYTLSKSLEAYMYFCHACYTFDPSEDIIPYINKALRIFSTVKNYSYNNSRIYYFAQAIASRCYSIANTKPNDAEWRKIVSDLEKFVNTHYVESNDYYNIIAFDAAYASLANYYGKLAYDSYYNEDDTAYNSAIQKYLLYRADYLELSQHGVKEFGLLFDERKIDELIDFYLYKLRVIGSLLINKDIEDNSEEIDKIVENCNFALMRGFRHDYNEHHNLDIMVNAVIAIASLKQYKMYSNDQNIDKMNDYATQYYNVVTTLLKSQNQNEEDDLFIVLISSLMFTFDKYTQEYVTDYYEKVDSFI